MQEQPCFDNNSVENNMVGSAKGAPGSTFCGGIFRDAVELPWISSLISNKPLLTNAIIAIKLAKKNKENVSNKHNLV